MSKHPFDEAGFWGWLMGIDTKCETTDDSDDEDDCQGTETLKPGPLTRNPFFNLLRELRQKRKGGRTIFDVAIEGARIWNQMCEAEKECYRAQARQASKCSKKKNRSGSGSPSGGTSAGCSHGNKTCWNLGPVTRNPFLNFLREMRQCCVSGEDMVEVARKGGQVWRKLSKEQKAKFIAMARKAPKGKKSGCKRSRSKGRKSNRSRSRSRSRSKTCKRRTRC